MQLKIVQAGDPVLREPGRPLTPAEIAGGEIQQLIELMRETMREAPGVGLAAPQIGLPLQLAVIEDAAENDAAERAPVPFHVIANPRLTLGVETIEFFEGCLSVDGFQAVVPRARTARVEALGFSKKDITRLKAFECVRTGVDAYAAILTKQKDIIPAPYLARAKWVRFDDLAEIDAAEMTGWLATAHALAAARLTRKQRAELGL